MYKFFTTYLAKYRDGFDEPRGGFSPRRNFASSQLTSGPCNFRNADTFLPDPRTVSSAFHVNNPVTSSRATHMLPLFGQFLDHDLTLTPEIEQEDCCSNNNRQEGCFANAVSINDPFFRQHNQICLEFTRSTPFCQQQSQVREQFNDITAFIDASNVYGSEEETARRLRRGAFGRGQLRVDVSPQNKAILPILFDEEENENHETAGDVRARENPALASLHTLFLREHNRLAFQISQANSRLTDEEVYQRARKINGAQMQNIVYNEFLPVVLGSAVQEEQLDIIPGRTNFRPNVDPSITNAFATAAFRFGHSMIQDQFDVYRQRRIRTNAGDSIRTTVTRFRLRDNFLNLDEYHAQSDIGLEDIIYGAINQDAQVIMQDKSKNSNTSYVWNIGSLY